MSTENCLFNFDNNRRFAAFRAIQQGVVATPSTTLTIQNPAAVLWTLVALASGHPCGHETPDWPTTRSAGPLIKALQSPPGGSTPAVQWIPGWQANWNYRDIGTAGTSYGMIAALLVIGLIRDDGPSYAEGVLVREGAHENWVLMTRRLLALTRFQLGVQLRRRSGKAQLVSLLGSLAREPGSFRDTVLSIRSPRLLLVLMQHARGQPTLREDAPVVRNFELLDVNASRLQIQLWWLTAA